LNVGIAFQIIDDYLALTTQERKLVKTSGQNIRIGEFTLPILNLLKALLSAEREEKNVIDF
jgi:geranylgeranyl pyrophosphate synthase